MAQSFSYRPRAAAPPARRKGFLVFCAVVTVLIAALAANPFRASAGHATEAAGSGGGQHGEAAAASDPIAGSHATHGTTADGATAGGEATSGEDTTAGATGPIASVIPAETMQRLLAAGGPIYCGAGTQPLVALTFDDGPGVNTQETIDLLKSRGMTATFFTVGKLYEAAPGWADLLRVEAGFGAVGDHTWDHVSVADMSASELDAQILRTQREAEKLSGEPVVLFRPPLGARSDTLDRYLQEHGLLEIMWSIETGDSQGARANDIYDAVAEHLSQGDIILLHEGRGTTQLALPDILDLIQERGYQTVTVPQLLAMDPPSNSQLRQHSCPG